MYTMLPANGHHHLSNDFSECSGLDSSWDNLETTTQFPVNCGTTVTVSCGPGYELKGDNQITCDRDTSFTYDTEPTCQKLGKL